MSELQLETIPVDDHCALIRVAGILDAQTFEQLDETLNRLMDGGTNRIAVDLRGLDQVSAAGAGVFIGTHAILKERGGALVLSDLAQPVRELFDLLGLPEILAIAATSDEAVRLAQGK